MTVISTYSEELACACAAAAEAGQLALGLQSGIQSTAKSDGSPVTQGDLAADAVIRHYVRQRFPDDGILSEEGVDDPTRLNARRVWIIDPIDGTKDYVDGGMGWCVQIALAVEGALVLGVLDLPRHGLQLLGEIGQGAYCISRDQRAPLRHDAVPNSTTLIASSSTRNAGALQRMRDVLPEFAVTTCTSVGVKVHHLLRGDADLYVHARPINEWDVAAPAAVLIAAGGSATALNGAPLTFNTQRGASPGLVFSTRPDHTALVSRLSAAGMTCD